jgi:DNA-binding transcriptional ArsR family regulator
MFYHMVERRSVVLDATYAALADPTRRAILQRLRRGEARVTDVAAGFPVSLNAVSKHVRVLEKAGLVSREIRGRDHVLRTEPAALVPAAAWITDYRSFWEDRADALVAHVERSARAKKKAGT